MKKVRLLVLIAIIGACLTLWACGGGGGGTSPTEEPGPGAAVDTDGDGIADTADNCPSVANADQTDQILADGSAGSNGVGDVCEPAGVADTYVWIRNAPLVIDAAAQGLLANAQFADSVVNFGEECAFATGTCVDTNVDPLVASTRLRGTVAIDAAGLFVYTPPGPGATIPAAAADGDPGLQSDGSVLDRFEIIPGSSVVAGVNGVPSPVTITMADTAWFVQNNTTSTTPDGTLANPFANLRDARQPTPTDPGPSAAGDFIFVLSGDGTTAGQDIGILLLDNQKLIGQGIALAYPGFSVNGSTPAPKTIMMPSINPISGTPLSAGTPPAITNTGVAEGAVAVGAPVDLANNNEVAGLRLVDSNEEKIMGGLFPESGITGFNIHDNVFDETDLLNAGNAEDIFLFAAGGTGVIANNTMTDSGREAIRFINFDTANLATAPRIDIIGTLTITGNTIASPAQSGIHIELGSTGPATSSLIVTIDGGNSISGIGTGEDAIDVQLHDAATMSLTIDNATLTAAQVNSGEQGINFDANDDSQASLVVTGNNISGFVLNGMELQTNDDAALNTTAVVDALVDGNTMTGNATGFAANAAAATLFCLELTNNDSTGNTSNPLAGYSITAAAAELTFVHDETLAPNTGDPIIVDDGILEPTTIGQGTCGGL